MEQEILKTIALGVSFFVVAVLYSSVGHGGASGYLLILSFLSFSPLQMSSTALILNLLVAGTSSYVFYRNGYLSLKFTSPFIIASIPAAFLGGMLKVSPGTYSLLLGITLLLVALRLVFEMHPPVLRSNRKPDFIIILPAGIIIGLFSGIIGIGGGILLSPLILLMGWADIKQASATAALFILVNSLAGLGARFIQSDTLYILPQGLLPYIVVAFAGGLIG
ncbi:MAG: sulfite exporter TauE/SafE family protein, partial [Planctomycetota bacterium]|nr:sulfite exporter TauE/SafE family protein [Planctomycetota bacterium]